MAADSCPRTARRQRRTLGPGEHARARHTSRRRAQCHQRDRRGNDRHRRLPDLMRSGYPPMTDSPIRIMCVDDHRLMREGIALIIGLDPSLTVVAEASTGEEAVAHFVEQRPDVTLMDLQLPGMNGLQAINAIRRIQADARIIVLTMYAGDTSLYHALQAGARGYLLKDAVPQDLIRTIHEVHAGKKAIPPHVEAMLAEHDTRPLLTAREIEGTREPCKGHAEQGNRQEPSDYRGDRPRPHPEHLREAERSRPDGRARRGPAARHRSRRIRVAGRSSPVVIWALSSHTLRSRPSI